MDRQKIMVNVAGRSYTLVSSDPPEHVKRVAEYVDRKISETAAATNLPSAQVAVLTCFNLADELIKLKGLFEEGYITWDEFLEQKRKLLGE